MLRPWQLLVGVVFLLPLFIMPGPDGVRIAKVFWLAYLGYAAFGIYLGKKVHWSIGLLYTYLGINAVYSGFSGWQVMAMLFPTLTAVISLFAVKLSEKDTYRVFTALGVSIFIQCGYGLLQMLGIDPIFQRSDVGQTFYMMPVGTQGQQTILGIFIGPIMAGMYFWGKRWRMLSFAFLPVLLATQSSTSISSYLAGLAAMLLLQSRKLFFWVASACVSVVTFLTYYKGTFLNMSLNGRMLVWKVALNLWKDAPYMGYGPGSWGSIVEKLFPSAPYLAALRNQGVIPSDFQLKLAEHREIFGIFLQVHNEFVQMLFENGVIGLLLSLVAIFFFYKKVLENSRDTITLSCGAMLTGIFVSGLSHFPLHLALNGTLAAIFYVLVMTRQCYTGINNLDFKDESWLQKISLRLAQLKKLSH